MKTLTFNNIANEKQLYDLTEAFLRAQNAADGFQAHLLGVQIGAVNLMGILARVVGVVGRLFGPATTKSVRSVGRAAKEARKELAAFDELNRLDDTSTPGSGGGAAAGMGEEFDIRPYQDVIDRLTAYVSGALLGLGAILAFSGANIPLGLGLMAAGAVGLASVVRENWGHMSDGVRTALTRVAGVLGGAALAMGAILAFSGANLPLGLGLMLAGGAGLAAAATLNWDYIPGKLRQVWQSITGWWAGNIAPKLTLSFWADAFSGIGQGLTQKVKDGVNSSIALLNRFISWVNGALFLQWGGLNVFGKTIIPAGSYQLLTIPSIPMLAQGAVIPPNAPFLAMLGDQKNGTNIETPEALLRQVIREESGGELLREQNELLRQILAKTGVYLDGREIGEAVTCYQSRMSRSMGV